MQQVSRTVINGTFLAVDNNDLYSLTKQVVGNLGEVQVLCPKKGGGVMFKAELRGFAENIEALGGVLVPQLFLSNTNTGKRALAAGIGIFRMVCSNGLVISLGDSLDAKIRHVNGPKANQFLDILPEILLAQIDRIRSGALFDTLLDALETPVSNPVQVVGNLPVADSVKDIVIDRIVWNNLRKEDNPATAWGLYNIVNEVQRRCSRSDYTAYTKDIGLLDHVIALADAA